MVLEHHYALRLERLSAERLPPSAPALPGGEIVRPLTRAEFSIRSCQPYTSLTLETSELLINGAPTGTILTGTILEAAVAWQDNTIAFLTDDVPFEDMLRIYMLDAQHRVIDSAMLGAMYLTGKFDDLVLLPLDTITFSFIGGITWRLVLLQSAEFAIPWFSDPRGACRPLKFTRRFRLLGKPLPGP